MVGWSAELLSGAVGAIGWMWVSVADGWLGCAVVVVGGAERAVGGTLCWRHLVLLVEMEDWMFWSGTVGAMGGTDEWGHGAVCDGGGRWELAINGLWGAAGAWW